MRHDFKREKTSEYTRRRRAKRNARVYLVPFDVDIVVRLCFFLDVVLCCKNQNENSRRLRWTSQRRRLGRSPKLIRFFFFSFLFSSLFWPLRRLCDHTWNCGVLSRDYFLFQCSRQSFPDSKATTLASPRVDGQTNNDFGEYKIVFHFFLSAECVIQSMTMAQTTMSWEGWKKPLIQFKSLQSKLKIFRDS